MRVGLSTDLSAMRPGSGLTAAIFSGPDDCAVLVFSLQTIGNVPVFLADVLSLI
jgi:hypothetical protein